MPWTEGFQEQDPDVGRGAQSVLGFRALLNAKGAAGRPQGFPDTHCTLCWAVMESSTAETSGLSHSPALARNGNEGAGLGRVSWVRFLSR